MANRFNQYQHVNYVGLPIDAYQMAAGAVEQENISQLQTAKSAYDGLQEIEASYNPDIALKGEILDNIRKQISGVANKNLKGTDTLMQIQKIVNDRNVIGKLADIQANTVNYKAALAANKKYVDDYGNDINIQPAVDQIESYNKLTSKDFKPGMLAGYTPGKFMDIVGDAQKLLKDAKGNSYEKVWSNGQYIYKSGLETLTEDELLKKAMPLFNDPKYATQLKNLSYYTLKNYGSTPAEALSNYNKSYVNSLNDEITRIVGKVKEYESLVKTKPGQGYEKLIEKGTKAIAELAKERDDTTNDTTGSIFSKNLKQGLAKSALSPYTYEKTIMSQMVDAFGLAKYKSGLAFDNWRKKHEIEKKEEIERNPVNPIIGTVALKDGKGQDMTQAAAILSADGGFKMENIGQTIGFLVQSTPKLLDENSNPVEMSFKNKQELSNNIQQAIKNGQAVISYLPGKKEYMISMADGKKYRMPADLNMQQAMEPLYNMYSTNPVWKEEQNVSLDGKTLSKVIITRQEGDNASYLYTPITNDYYDPYKLKGEDIKKLTGMNITNPLIFQATESLLPGESIKENSFDQKNSSGVRILVEGRFSDNNDGKSVETKAYTFSPQKFEKAKAMGFQETGNHVIYTTGPNNTVQFIRGLDGGPANSNIINSHMKYESQPTRRLNFLKNNDARKTTKVEMNESETESDSESTIGFNEPKY